MGQLPKFNTENKDPTYFKFTATGESEVCLRLKKRKVVYHLGSTTEFPLKISCEIAEVK